MITGSGGHTYEVHHDWLVPPDGLLYGDTHGLATDSAGRVYLAHTVHPDSPKTDAVLVFDSEGNFVKSWGAEFREGAHGLDLREENGEEFLYLCDVNRRLLVKTTLDGDVLWRKGTPKESGVYGVDEEWNPTNVAFAPSGDVFVGDGYGKSYVLRFTANGEFVSVVCGPGEDAGQVKCPHGLWVDSRSGKSRLAVADRGNRRIQYFTLEGEHIGFLTEGIRMPCHIHFNSRGEMLIPDLESVVTVLGRDDSVLAQLCDGHPTELRGEPKKKFIPGRFIHPHGAIWLDDRDILVAEWVPQGRVTLLKRVGGHA